MSPSRAFTLIELLIPRQASSTKLGTSRDTSFYPARDKSSQGFTLIELLLVIAVIAILSVVVVLSLNPGELLRESRDTTRISDLDTLNRALSLVTTDQATQGISLNLGNASTVYVSLIDTASSTCGSLGLPALPTGYVYHCATATSSRLTNGQGWIPISFSSSTNPLGALPLDPQNSSSSNLYYTYQTNGSLYRITAFLESQKEASIAENDGGSDPTLMESGSGASSLPDLGRGLVGYWPLDEGGGTSVTDWSGSGNGGGSTIDWMTSGCKLSNCVTAINGYGTISVNSPTFSNIHSNVTLTNWVEVNTAIPSSSWPYSAAGNTHISYGFRSASNGTKWRFEYGTDYPTCSGSYFANPGGDFDLGLGTWHLMAATYDGQTIKIYLDGTIINQTSFSTGFCGITSFFMAAPPPTPGSFNVDDVRIYNRALSSAEIQEIYNAEK